MRSFWGLYLSICWNSRWLTRTFKTGFWLASTTTTSQSEATLENICCLTLILILWSLLSNLGTRACVTITIWRCGKLFSQWHRSFQRKLRCHWLKFLRQRHVAVVRQGPGPCITNVFATHRKNSSQWHRSFQRKLRSYWLKFLRHVVTNVRNTGPWFAVPGSIQVPDHFVLFPHPPEIDYEDASNFTLGEPHDGEKHFLLFEENEMAPDESFQDLFYDPSSSLEVNWRSTSYVISRQFDESEFLSCPGLCMGCFIHYSGRIPQTSFHRCFLS